MIQMLLLIAIVGLATAHFLKPRPEGVEGFHDAPTAEDDTLGPAADHPSAADEVDDNPLDLPWIASWTPADRAARRGMNCLPKYIEAGPDGTTILTVSKSCEAGMAHTRPGDRIILPDSIPLPHRAETIDHEMIHIYQRRDPAAWIQFYRRNWSFELHVDAPATAPRELREARRSNPDTWTADAAQGGQWACWKGRFWPVPVYTDPQQPRLRDAHTVWWDEWRNEILTEPPVEWTAFFGSPAQDEHPHELAATMIVAEDTMSEAGRRLMNWWRSR